MASSASSWLLAGFSDTATVAADFGRSSSVMSFAREGQMLARSASSCWKEWSFSCFERAETYLAGRD